MSGPAWIVLPTFCEAENLERMTRALRAALPADARILVVDDASPEAAWRVPVLHLQFRGGRADLDGR